eukprot:SAG31_NODE_276_length_18650_cov_5.821842_17_plen_91_part_00
MTFNNLSVQGLEYLFRQTVLHRRKTIEFWSRADVMRCQTNGFRTEHRGRGTDLYTINIFMNKKNVCTSTKIQRVLTGRSKIICRFLSLSI